MSTLGAGAGSIIKEHLKSIGPLNDPS